MSEPRMDGAILDEYYEAVSGNPVVEGYHERHGTESACILTVYTDYYADAVAEYLRERITGKIVVEVGAGIGLLACHLAQYAKRVYAIEVDPAWASVYVWQLYAKKPANLTYIFGKAEEAPYIAADIALFCTHSGHAALYAAAARFAPVVIDVYREILPPGTHERVFAEAAREVAMRSAEALSETAAPRELP